MNSDEFQKFLREFMEETDRAAIVLGAAHIDALLEEILKKRLIDPKKDLFDFNGPFGTFSARIYTAYATGVIDKPFLNKLNILRKIRNSCAHNIETVDLNSEKISQQITSLAEAFADTDFWEDTLAKAKELFGKDGNTLVLRVAVAFLIANLAMIKSAVSTIDNSSVFSVVCPDK